MLSEFRSTNITWDKATSRIYSPVTANESDENGRKLVVQIVNGGQVEDLTGATLHLYWETRDKLHDGLDVFKAVDLKKGEFELSYTAGMLSNKGVLNANLVLINTTGRVVSERFKITVTEGINNDRIQSENSFTSLTRALIDIINLEQNYAPRLIGVETGLSDLENKVIVESGRNENGNWMKFVDGTMICTVTKQTNDDLSYPWAQLFRTGSTRWVYPIPFLVVPQISAFPASGASYTWASIGQSASLNSECDFGVFSADKRVGVKPFVSLTAIGRWK